MSKLLEAEFQIKLTPILFTFALSCVSYVTFIVQTVTIEMKKLTVWTTLNLNST